MRSSLCRAEPRSALTVQDPNAAVIDIHGTNRMATALRLAATSLLYSPTALSASGQRLRSRLEAPKAITGVARKLAVLVDRLLKHGEADVKRGVDEYEAQYQDRRLAALRRSASEWGFHLETLPAQ